MPFHLKCDFNFINIYEVQSSFTTGTGRSWHTRTCRTGRCAGGLIGLASGRFSLGQVAVPVGVGIGVGTGVPIVTSVVTAVI